MSRKRYHDGHKAAKVEKCLPPLQVLPWAGVGMTVMAIVMGINGGAP